MKIVSFVNKKDTASWAKSDIIRFTHDGMDFWALSTYQSIMTNKAYYHVGQLNGVFKSVIDIETESVIDDTYVPIWFHTAKVTNQPFVCFSKLRNLASVESKLVLGSNTSVKEDKVYLPPFMKVRLNQIKEHENVDVKFFEKKYNIWSGSWTYGIVKDEIRVACHNGKKRVLFYCNIGQMDLDGIKGISLFVKNRKPVIMVYCKNSMYFYDTDCFSMESDSLLTIKIKDPSKYDITMLPKGGFRFMKFNPILGYGCIAHSDEILFFPTSDPGRNTISDCKEPKAVGFSQDGYGIWSESNSVHKLKIKKD